MPLETASGSDGLDLAIQKLRHSLALYRLELLPVEGLPEIGVAFLQSGATFSAAAALAGMVRTSLTEVREPMLARGPSPAKNSNRLLESIID